MGKTIQSEKCHNCPSHKSRIFDKAICMLSDHQVTMSCSNTRVSGSLLPPCGSMVHVQGKPDVTVMLSSDSSGKTDFSLEDSLVNQASEGSGTEGLIP